MALVDVIFEGRSWGGAAAGGTIKFRDYLGGETHEAIEIRAKGGGRRHAFDEPAAFWRNFIEIDPTDEKHAVDFVQRHGDPEGKLPDKATDTGGWRGLGKQLEPFARLWGPMNDEGVSPFVGKAEEVIAVTEKFHSEFVDQNNLLDLRVGFRKSGELVGYYRAHALAGFMCASAILNAQDRYPMARCNYCNDFFAFKRRSSFCTPSCRALHSAATKGRNDG
jgi:hypothetical protein